MGRTSKATAPAEEVLRLAITRVVTETVAECQRVGRGSVLASAEAVEELQVLREWRRRAWAARRVAGEVWPDVIRWLDGMERALGRGTDESEVALVAEALLPSVQGPISRVPVKKPRR